jgi:hypothetical protein
MLILSCFDCRFNEFGTDGGPAAKALKPKFNSFTKNISAQLGVVVPHVEVGIFFMCDIFYAALMLLVINLFSFCSESIQLKHVIAATIGLKGLGGLLFIVSSQFGAYLLVCSELLPYCILINFLSFLLFHLYQRYYSI